MIATLKQELIPANVDTSIAPTSMPVAMATDGLVHMIERVARDPSIPLERLEKLLDMQQRVMRQRAEDAYNRAFAEMQPELPIIDEKGTHGGTNKSYAKWDDVVEAIMPVLGRHGFSLRFRVKHGEGKIAVTGKLAHKDGYSEETTHELPIDNSGQKNAVQGIGSSQSYGQRYVAKALLSLSSRKSDDNDGGSQSETIMQDQVDAINDLIKKRKIPTEKFMQWLKTARIDRIEDIPVTQYARCIQALNNYKGNGA